MNAHDPHLLLEVDRALADADATLQLAAEIRGAIAGSPERLWRRSR
jgi:hypothetical protein